jgi:citrate lyase subunit beta/citryl-CoA lyase
MTHDAAGVVAAVDRAEARRAALEETFATRRVRLPLRYLRQAAHYTTPATDESMARKAVAGGTAPVGRILDRLGLSSVDLADRLGVPVDRVDASLRRPRDAPLVMLDLEDAIAPGDEAAARGVAVAVDVLADAARDGAGVASLRAIRPPRLVDPGSAAIVASVLAGLHARSGEDHATSPLDAIVIPKIEHPEEVGLVHDLLGEVEAALGLPVGGIRVAYLVESGWGLAQLPAIARAADRLCAIVFGLADYAADLGLADIATDHPLADHARAEIVNVAGAVGVPAIDGMTLAYPVADPGLDAAANRERFLERMSTVYADAVHARSLGMAGKWVGHPAQLLAVLLAFEADFEPDRLEAEAAKLASYAASVAADRGATMIDGVMSDRATDRHARARLRQATAAGRFDPDRALALGVIEPAELAEARAAMMAATGGSAG